MPNCGATQKKHPYDISWAAWFLGLLDPPRKKKKSRVKEARAQEAAQEETARLGEELVSAKRSEAGKCCSLCGWWLLRHQKAQVSHLLQTAGIGEG